jgi:putative ABC transport system permease protein
MSNLILDALVTGLPLVPAVLGIYLTFRLREDFDLTIDASFTVGATALTVVVMRDLPAPLALVVATLVAGAMGLVTTALHLVLRIPVILAGLIMSIGFYSVSLRGLERPSMSLLGTPNILAGARDAPSETAEDLIRIGIFGAIITAVLVAVGLLLRTETGLALRATGVNPAMARSCGVNDRAMLALALFLANGLAGLSGALVVEGQNFVDVNMGAGTLIAGVGAVLVGDLILRPAGSKVLRMMLAALIGALLYRFILVLALRMGVPATDLKGVTALILVAALAVERFVRPVLGPMRPRRREPTRVPGAAVSAQPKEAADARTR